MYSLLLVLMVLLTPGYPHRNIHLHQSGNDDEACLNGTVTSQVSQYCRSLEFIASKVQNESQSVTILLESKIAIESQITFANLDFLAIKGNVQGTKLICYCQERDNAKWISFQHIKKLELSHSAITHCCGSVNFFNAAILIQECANITIDNFNLYENKYSTALLLVNPQGEVIVKKCNFRYNGHIRKKNESSYAGGLQIVFYRHTIRTRFVVENCKFIQNRSPQIPSKVVAIDLMFELNKKKGFGGGIGVELLSNSTSIDIYVLKCMFKENLAKFGGGVSVYVQRQTFNNTFLVSNSTFERNTANKGGGGVQVRLDNLEKYSKNFICFRNVSFVRNTASFGGGTSISTSLGNQVTEPGEILQFINCTWYANAGYYSQAVDVSPHRYQQSSQGYTIVPLFQDINIYKNQEDSSGHSRITQGVFVITHCSVYMQGNITFQSNLYAALYLTSSRVIFNAKSNVLFQSNVGIKGGAIALHGFSTLVVNDFSQFIFDNNSATQVGGGIYYASADQREYFNGRTCFIEYGGEESIPDKRQIHFHFIENKAPLGGLSIYAESIFSCYYAFFEESQAMGKNLTELFDQLGYFSFDSPRLNVAPLATAVRKMVFNQPLPIETLPGKLLVLPLAMFDEFGTISPSGFSLRVENNEIVKLNNHFSIDNTTRIFGAPNQTVTLVLSTPQSLLNVDYYVPVSLLACPPGFHYSDENNRCLCSADRMLFSYPAMTQCDYKDYRAYIKQGYWVGYYPNDSADPEDLYTAFYPSLFNYQKYSEKGLRLIVNNSEDLSDFICGNNREGILCGSCKAGYSAYYTSRKFTCGVSTLCRFGILFYILSEIFPTLIFFTTVTTLGISFSSGAMNGFIFFSQVVDVFSQDLILSEYLEKGNSVVNVLQSGYQLAYGIFNIDFFSIFPYCLWKGATVMDVLVFKYVTSLFALMLILIIIVFMNNSSNTCKRFCNSKWSRKDSSVTHGISTFLIICYGQYTRVSFYILTRTYLLGRQGVTPIPVTYYGGIPYLQGKHLLYAIPAIMFTGLLVILPPLCLLLYPTMLHLLALCGLSEHPIVSKILQLLHVNRLLPLFDSFQSCYKDRLRCFSGLYFLYRVAAFLAYMHNETIPPVFLAVMMLGIHSVLQPYKLWKYNVIDGLVFLNIAIINSITEMIKSSVKIEILISVNILNLKLVQIAFIYLPVITLLMSIVTKLIRRLCTMWKSARFTKEAEVPSSPITSRDSEPSRIIPLGELNTPLLKDNFEYTLQCS